MAPETPRQTSPRLYLTRVAVLLLAVGVTNGFAANPAAITDRAWLQERATRHFEDRKRLIDALGSVAEVEAYLVRCRTYFEAEIGPWPQRTPLRARLMGHVERDGIRVERVIYESQPGLYVTGLIFRPLAPGRYPGVVVSCGHEPESKAAEFNQQPAILLARSGFVALSFDPIGQWERTQVSDSLRAAHQHQLLGIGCTLTGIPLANTMIWDAMRALDYLQSRPDVDPDRLGATGYSGGGNLTALLMALDARVRCAVPAVFLSSLPRVVALYGAQDAEATFFGQIPAGFGHADYAALHAPRPMLLCAATRDNSPIEGTRETFAEALRIYNVLGARDRIDLVEADATHGYHRPLREAMAGWMARWLKDSDAAVTETPMKSFAMPDLTCTESGLVSALPGARTLFEINATRAAGWSTSRARLWREDAPAAIAQVRRLTGIPSRDGIRSRRMSPGEPSALVATDAPPIPIQERQPPAGSNSVSLIVHGSNAGDRADALAFAERELGRGKRIVAAEVMGTGRREDRQTRHRNFLEALGSNFEVASLAFKLGMPYLGLRAGEILECALFLAGADDARIDVFAVGEIVPAALHAVALEPELFRSLTIYLGLESWIPLLHPSTAVGQYAQVVPSALQYYDLPDLVAYARARNVTIIRDPGP